MKNESFLDLNFSSLFLRTSSKSKFPKIIKQNSSIKMIVRVEKLSLENKYVENLLLFRI